jgi:hypothetical protein
LILSLVFHLWRRHTSYPSVIWNDILHRLSHPPSTVTLRGPSIWVYAPSAPLWSLFGELIIVTASDISVCLRGLWILL